MFVPSGGGAMTFWEKLLVASLEDGTISDADAAKLAPLGVVIVERPRPSEAVLAARRYLHDERLWVDRLDAPDFERVIGRTIE